MPLVLLLVEVGLSGLLGGLVIVQDDEQAPELAWKAITSNTIGWNQLLGSRGAVLSHSFNKRERNETSLLLLPDIEGGPGLVGRHVGRSKRVFVTITLG